MEIILLKDVPKVGRRNELVTVSEGYAINFLIPRGLAKAATAGSRKDLEFKKEQDEAAAVEQHKKIAEGIKTITGKTITLSVKANTQGGLFGSIHGDAIRTAVNDQLDIILPVEIFKTEPLKHVGTFEVMLSSENVKGTLTVVVQALV